MTSVKNLLSKRREELGFRNLGLAQGTIDDARGDLKRPQPKERTCLDCGTKFFSEYGNRICTACHENEERQEIDQIVEGV
jgi:hypothetical protein